MTARDDGRAGQPDTESPGGGRAGSAGTGQPDTGPAGTEQPGAGPSARPDGRDRDAEGRARNARPRDAAGRPLPRGAAGVPRPDEDVVLDPSATLTEAQRLLDADRPFHAHEVLEGAWKAGTGEERALWQGLAQLAVGLTHAQRGNGTGAVSLLERGAERIAPFADRPPHRVDVAGLVAHATALAARIHEHGPDGLTEAHRRPRLTAPPA